MKRLITFSLWGDKPMYVVGAVRNAELARTVYPGWKCRFYVAQSVPPTIVQELTSMDHVEVLRVADPGDWRGMFWRFLPASEPGVDAMISRDTDSRLSERECAAVDDWLQSPAKLHIMRDHPYHRVDMPGGMWGIRGGLVPNIASLIAPFLKGNYWHIDQEFLSAEIFSRYGHLAMIHDEFFDRKRRFPTVRKGLEYVGQVFDEHDRITAPDHAEVLQQALDGAG